MVAFFGVAFEGEELVEEVVEGGVLACYLVHFYVYVATGLLIACHISTNISRRDLTMNSR
jgi:hypothetical protein